jgi:hypothetical protein
MADFGGSGGGGTPDSTQAAEITGGYQSPEFATDVRGGNYNNGNPEDTIDRDTGTYCAPYSNEEYVRLEARYYQTDSIRVYLDPYTSGTTEIAEIRAIDRDGNVLETFNSTLSYGAWTSVNLSQMSYGVDVAAGESAEIRIAEIETYEYPLLNHSHQI